MYKAAWSWSLRNWIRQRGVIDKSDENTRVTTAQCWMMCGCYNLYYLAISVVATVEVACRDSRASRVKSKRSTSLSCFIPSTILFCCSTRCIGRSSFELCRFADAIFAIYFTKWSLPMSFYLMIHTKRAELLCLSPYSNTRKYVCICKVFFCY